MASHLVAVAQSRAADERQLFERIAAGDPAAPKTVYDRTSGRALGIALRVLRQRSEAEEIVQETFVEIWKRARDFDPGRGGATAFVATIARTRAIDRLRSRSSAERVALAASKEE